MLGDQVAVMSAGCIVQAASARDVYDRPATRFVAGFIGDFNLLEPGAVARVFGVAVTKAWAIHPEAIDLGAPADDGLRAEATVTDLRIQGAVLRYLVMANGVELKVDVLNRASVATLAVGDAVSLRLDPAQVREIAD